MPGRSSAKDRCSRCQMYTPLCLCQEIPVFNLETRIIVFMHWRESKLTSNTAVLACLALPNSEIHLRGQKDQPLLTEQLLEHYSNAALLFPTEDAIELTPSVVANLPRPLTLIVPDGSWRQAKKVAIREQALKNLPKYKVTHTGPSTYRLRHSPHEQNLSTFEAISKALGILEGEEVQKRMDELFLKKVERTLWGRGLLKPSDCITKIPEGAILASHIAGKAGRA